MRVSPFTHDVAIIGSGPAGASAARVLARAGLKTVILEKSKIPRYKTCGGGILGRAVRFLGETSIPVAERACHSAEFNLSQELRFTASRKDPIVFMTMRYRFDEWLVQKAIDAGAQVCCNCAVQDVTVGSSEICLSTNQGDFRARYFVAADGAGGSTAQKAGWPDHRMLAPALECEVEVSSKCFDRFRGAARFDFHCVPKGYAWVFPKKSHLSIGVFTLDPTGVNLNQCFNQYLKFLSIVDPVSIQRHGFVIPLSPRDRTLARGSVLLVGDAAGFADPVTAEGISNAIFSGQLAGNAIVKGFSKPNEAGGLYNASVEQHILPDLRWAKRLAHLLYGCPRLRDSLFRWQGQQLTEVMTDLVAGKLGYKSLLTDPLNYLKLLGG